MNALEEAVSFKRFALKGSSLCLLVLPADGRAQKVLLDKHHT